MHKRMFGALTFLLLPAAMIAGQSGTDDGWRTLFDGRSLDGWRGYKQSQPPSGWKAQDGLLVRVSDGGDLITADQFRDFELALEWRVSEGGNSGIFYRAAEDTELIWHNAPEYQILDNARHRDGKDPLTSAAACYGLFAPVKDVTRSPGAWNETRIVARGAHVEHWLNGVKVVEFEIGSEVWKAHVGASKFKVYARFGERPKGHIGLQDHGDPVAYRNIRIRELR